LKVINLEPENLVGSHIRSLFIEPEVQIEDIVENNFLSIEQKSVHQNDHGDIFQSFYFFNSESSDIVLFSIDITESKKTQEAYQQVNIENRKLNKINELLDNIIFMTAHDLRSPISNLKLINHLINESNDMGEKLELLEKVAESTNRMENVINGLVEIIEVQKEGIERPKKVSFEKVFEHVYAEHEDMLVNLDAKLNIDFSRAPEINYQEAFLISIFNNLIGNAIKYHSKHPLEISVHTEKVPGFIVLVVSDNGIGIDLKKYYKTIFRPFSRIKENYKEGKGIGLHLVKTIVEKNGGSIEVESEPGKGAKFTIYLAEY
jgi:signal transduction histidine kinase